MPDSEWNKMLAEAAGEVLETMFFAGVYGPAQAGLYPPEPRVSARLAFEGTPSGALTVCVSEPAARSLAAGFLASEDDDPPAAAQIGSVVCELANMICGLLLSHVKTEDHFRLSTPELLSGPAACPLGQSDQSLDLGDGAIDLWLFLEADAN
jgi:hypothetical protein